MRTPEGVAESAAPATEFDTATGTEDQALLRSRAQALVHTEAPGPPSSHDEEIALNTFSEGVSFMQKRSIE